MNSRNIRFFENNFSAMIKTQNAFSYILITLVVTVIVMALLGIWEVIDWGFFRMYFWKCVKSLIVILFGGLVIYIIQSIFYKPEETKSNSTGSQHSN